MTADDLDACRQPPGDVREAGDTDQRAVFAVAVREGVLHADTPGRTLDQPHISVLYVTSDGEAAFAKRVAAGGGLSLVDRALIVDDRKLQAATDAAKRFAPIVQRHPEVA